MTYGHLQADCLYTGICSGPNARYRVWESLYLFYAPYGPLWANSTSSKKPTAQTYSIVVRGGTSDGNVYRKFRDTRTDRRTRRHAHRNTSHPYRGRNNHCQRYIQWQWVTSFKSLRKYAVQTFPMAERCQHYVTAHLYRPIYLYTR